MKKVMSVMVLLGLGVMMVNAQNTEKAKVQAKPVAVAAPASDAKAEKKAEKKEAVKPVKKENQGKKAEKPAEKK